MLSEAMVRQIIGVEGAEALIAITKGAWQDHLDEGRVRFHRTTRAQVVWDYMVQRCDNSLTEMDGVARVERLERPMYVLREKIMIRPKLHDRELMTRNYQTQAQKDLHKDGLFGGFEYANVAFGYMLDKAEAGIEQYVATSSTDAWVINLEELAAGEIRPVTPMLDMPNLDEEWRKIPGIRFKREGG